MSKNNENTRGRRSCLLSCVTLKLVFSSTTSDSFSAENCIKQQHATWRLQGTEVSGDKVDLLVPLNTCIHKCNKFCTHGNNNNKKNAKNKRQQWGHEQKQWEQLSRGDKVFLTVSLNTLTRKYNKWFSFCRKLHQATTRTLKDVRIRSFRW